MPPALLVLEDGTVHRGRSVGMAGETFGEFVFNTGMTGYQEVLTDPSYCGQIVVMTYPEIGIYGVNREDVESERIQVAGFVVSRAIEEPFNHRATMSLTDYLAGAGTVAIDGVDTRALTRHLRTKGAMRGAISALDLDPASLVARTQSIPSMLGSNLAEQVSPLEPTTSMRRAGANSADPACRVVIVDAGSKDGIADELILRGAVITAVPYDARVATVLSYHPDGVLVSNGPGDPAVLLRTVEMMRALLEKSVPLAGICLGHQLLGLALGGSTYKMCFGHRGSNHPVKDLTSGSVLITTQNHGFAVDPTSLGIPWQPLDSAYTPSNSEVLTELASRGKLADVGGTVTMADLLPEVALAGTSPGGFGPVSVTHLSLNDGTVEGIRLAERPAFSVQFHPEARPGPHDAQGFFDEFVSLMEAHRA
jgi:carbamoyl-phosphate synthase small subunit